MALSINNLSINENGIIWAVVASMLLHTLVVVVVPNFKFETEEKAKPQVLKIELQKPTPPAPVVEPLPPIDIPEPPKPKPKPKPVKKKPKPIVKPKPVQKVAPTPVVAPVVEPPPVVEEVVPEKPVVQPPKKVVPPPPPPGPTQADIDAAKRAYGNLLTRGIAKHKSYPKIAARRGWEGTVMLTLKIDSSGNVLSATVRDSSGHDALDKRALKMVKKAAPFPVPPEILQGPFTISVPVAFKLNHG